MGWCGKLPLGHGAKITDANATKAQIREADMGFLESLKTIKRALDPNGIMSPGRLGFEVNDLRD